MRSLSPSPGPLARSSGPLRWALLLWAVLSACSTQPEGTGRLVDPTRAQADMGTLVDISDVLEVAQRMVESLRRDAEVAALIKAGRPVRVLVEEREIKNLTSMAQFNKRIFVNQLLAQLNRAAGEDLQFLDREAVALERARQAGGEVSARAPTGAAAGAELVLSGRILEKLDRRAAQGGAVLETRSVQFSFSLVRVKDAVTLWTEAFFRVKQQVQGTVYS